MLEIRNVSYCKQIALSILVADIFVMAAGMVDPVQIFLLSTSLCKILLLFLMLCARVEGHKFFSDARALHPPIFSPLKQGSSTCVMVPNLVNTKNWGC